MEMPRGPAAALGPGGSVTVTAKAPAPASAAAKPAAAAPRPAPSPAPAAAKPKPKPAAKQTGSAASPAATKPAPAAAKPAVSPSSSAKPAVSPSPSAPTTPQAWGGPTTPTTAAQAGAESASAGAGATKAGGSQEAAALPVGELARIQALQSKPHLNGELCCVLRPAETPERLTVRTRFGDLLSLKYGNLAGGRAVYPKGCFASFGALLAMTVACSACVFLTTSGILRTAAAATLPVLLPLWFGLTLGFGYVLHRPAMEPDLRVPSVSEMGSGARAPRIVACVGLLGAALTLAVTLQLFDEALVSKLGPMPPPVPPALSATSAEDGPRPVDAEADASESGGHDLSATAHAESDAADGAEEASAEVKVAEAAEETKGVEPDGGAAEVEDGAPGVGGGEETTSPSTLDGTVQGKAAPTKLGNDTNATNSTNSSKLPPKPPPEWMPRHSILWGYAAAVGLALQGLVSFEARMSLRALIHVAAACLFVIGATQHAQQSSTVFSSMRGAPIIALSPWIASATWLRQQAAVFGPLAVMALPLCSQVSSGITQTTKHRGGLGAKNIMKASGLHTSVRLGQWSASLVFMLFFCTYAVDLWFAVGTVIDDGLADAAVE